MIVFNPTRSQMKKWDSGKATSNSINNLNNNNNNNVNIQENG